MQISLKTSLKNEVRRKDDNKVICSGQQLNSGYRRDWRSGYKLIDDLIRDIRLEYPHPSYQLEWIPFSEFVGLKFISRGGFSAIYESTWTNTNQTVALKCLDGSKDFSSEFLIKIKKHWSLYLQPQFSRCYGITQLPNSREFMMVMQYAPFGDLSSHLKRNYIYTWKEKIKIVKQIANGISDMHKRNLIHGDLHSGNILNIDQSHFVITDVGLCGPAGNTFVSKNAIHGVLPYVAPEILKGHPLTNKSDIYSFGIIMWEICTGSKPFSEVAHDLKLAKDICNRGKRPQIPTGTPSFYFELMKSCWDPDPDKRPDAHYISNSIDFWLTNDSLNDHLKNGGSMISSTNINNDKNIHPKAIYYSRLLDFPDLLNGKKIN